MQGTFALLFITNILSHFVLSGFLYVRKYEGGDKTAEQLISILYWSNTKITFCTKIKPELHIFYLPVLLAQKGKEYCTFFTIDLPS